MADVRGVPQASEGRKKQKGMTFPRRGDIYLVEFDPARGHEIRKTRPAPIVQNDIGNRHSPAHHRGRHNVEALDRQRLVKRLGAAKAETMRKVDDALRISLGLVPALRGSPP